MAERKCQCTTKFLQESINSLQVRNHSQLFKLKSYLKKNFKGTSLEEKKAERMVFSKSYR
jgi:hypothetical protein